MTIIYNFKELDLELLFIHLRELKSENDIFFFTHHFDLFTILSVEQYRNKEDAYIIVSNNPNQNYLSLKDVYKKMYQKIYLSFYTYFHTFPNINTQIKNFVYSELFNKKIRLYFTYIKYAEDNGVVR